MADLTELLFKRRRATLLFILLLACAGLACIGLIPITFYPQTAKPKMQISVSASGYAAEDLYDDYDTDAQNIMAQIEDIELVTASYSSGRMSYILEFPWNVSTTEAKTRAVSAADSLKNLLPGSFNDPTVSYYSEDSSGYLALALYSPQMANNELYTEAKAILENRIGKARDLDSFNISNVRQLRAEVELNPDTLLSLGLKSSEVISAVQSGYKNSSMGSFRDGRVFFTLRAMSSAPTIFDIGQIPIKVIGKQSILLQDVADVNVRYDLPRNVYRANGEEAIFILAYPTQDGNVKNMAEDVKAIVQASLPEFSKSVENEIFVDPAQFINKAVNNVLQSAVSGALLAILVTLAFLGIPKNTLIVVMSIPLSTLYAFIFLYFFKVSINLISLSGLALSVGMTVDASIVVMENIHRHRIEARSANSEEPLARIIARSVKEVRASVIASVITSVCVFFPLSFTAPLASAILGDLAMAVVFTLACSLIVSFTVIPTAAFYLFRSEHQKNGTKSKHSAASDKIEQFSNRLMHFLKGRYQFFLVKLLGSAQLRFLFIGASAALLAVSLFIVLPRIRTEIIANPDSANITIFARNSEVDNINDFMDAFSVIEEEAINLLGDRMVSRFLETQGITAGSLFITLTSSKLMQESIELLQQRFISDNVWSYSIAAYDPAKMPIPRTYALQIRVSGPDRKKITAYMEQIVDIAQQVRNKDNERAYLFVFTDPTTMATTEMAMQPRHEVFGELSPLTQSELVSHARLYLNSSTPFSMTQDGDEIDAIFSFPDVSSREDVLNILVPYNGKALPLNHFFDMEIREGISRISIEDEYEVFDVKAVARQAATMSEIKQYENAVRQAVEERLNLESGYAASFIDAQAVINESVSSLGAALLISIVLIYVVLAMQFNSFKTPIVILTAVPLGAIGAILCLKAFNSTLSLNSMLGIILLGGTAVNNSIILVDFYLNTDSKLSKIDAIVETCLLRFSPILSSTTTTLLGMLPIALALGDGANVIQPLGIAVSGGLAISTLFTLFMIPTILSFAKRPSSNTRN